MFDSTRKALKQLWKSWIRRSPKIPSVTMRDVQNEAAQIGGSLFTPIPNTKQSFFWYPDIDSSTPKVGEFVYISQYLPDNERAIPKVTSHIHYSVSSNALGEVTVTKSIAGQAGSGTPIAKPLDNEELRDLATAVTLLNDRLASSWS